MTVFLCLLYVMHGKRRPACPVYARSRLASAQSGRRFSSPKQRIRAGRGLKQPRKPRHIAIAIDYRQLLSVAQVLSANGCKAVEAVTPFVSA